MTAETPGPGRLTEDQGLQPLKVGQAGGHRVGQPAAAELEK